VVGSLAASSFDSHRRLPDHSAFSILKASAHSPSKPPLTPNRVKTPFLVEFLHPACCLVSVSLLKLY
jgi:hypothetical protein